MFEIDTYHDEGLPGAMVFGRSRGTPTSPTALINNDAIFSLEFGGRTGGGTYGAAYITATVGGVVSPGVLPGRMNILTTSTLGVPSIKLSIGPDGQLTLVAPALVAGGASGQVNVSSILSWMKVSFNSVEYAIPMYAINP